LYSLWPPSLSTLRPYTTLFRSFAAGLGLRGLLGGDHVGPAVLGLGFGQRLRGRRLGRDRGGARVGRDLVRGDGLPRALVDADGLDRKSTRLNSSHVKISYAAFC